ncbi:RNA-binding protein 45-like isoform X2 [Babylonia areolata]|uniref:RNA-binding protein 45-like isoform X2 n=1 Tax=Babylonia areolata TaxID=304850 RepID=UPI003FD62C21
MAFRSEDPPHSRLFILCQKGTTEKEFREKFSEFGKVEDIWIVKDKRTNEDRGIVYIKFSKSSEALLAMEEMNGRSMPGQPKPLKVVVANSKRDGSTRDPREDEKLVRLFVVCPKHLTEKDLQNEFEKYGDLDHVTVIRDRSSGDSKGFGYVKYHRAYHAALAYENCNQIFKPKFAEPQRSRDERENSTDFYTFGQALGGFMNNMKGQKRTFEEEGSFNRDNQQPMPMQASDPWCGGPAVEVPGNFGVMPPNMMGGVGPMTMLNDYPTQSNCCRIQIVAPIGMTQGYLTKLFNLIPGMEYCDLNESTGVAYARYATPQCAAYARDKLNGFEYPIGSQLMVQFADESAGQQNNPGCPGGRNDEMSDLRQRAASLLEQAGINPQAVMVAANNAAAMFGMMGAAANGMERVNYCNIMLPLPQPLVNDDSVVAKRLFIVCQPSAVAERVLRDAFCRFGNLISVYLLSGRNFGYAKYASTESAMKAMQTLHGQNLSGQRIKVLEAEPPKQGGDDGPSKKQKI